MRSIRPSGASASKAPISAMSSKSPCRTTARRCSPGASVCPEAVLLDPETPSFAKDPSWAALFDELRPGRPASPRERARWRRETPVRGLVFEPPHVREGEPEPQDVVQLHLEHRLVKRLLSRFVSQGFRATVGRITAIVSSGAQPRVVLLGRLCLFGPGARRLHEEIIPVTAAWRDTRATKSPLMPFAEAGEAPRSSSSTTPCATASRRAQASWIVWRGCVERDHRRPASASRSAGQRRPSRAPSPISPRTVGARPKRWRRCCNGRSTRSARPCAASSRRKAPEQLEFFGPTEEDDPQAARARTAPVRGRPALVGRQAAAAPAGAGQRAREGPPRLRGAGAPAGARRPRLSLAGDELSAIMTYHARQDETSEWLNYLQPEGLVVGANVLRETGVTPIRQTPLDTEAAAQALRLDPEAPREQDRLFELARSLDLLRAGARLAGEARRRQPGWTGGRSRAERHGPGARDPARAGHGAAVERRGAGWHPGAGARHAASQPRCRRPQSVRSRRMGGDAAPAAGAAAARDQCRRRHSRRPQHACG